MKRGWCLYENRLAKGLFLAAASGALLAACASGVSTLTPHSVGNAANVVAHYSTSPLTVSPSKLSIRRGATASVTVEEQKYTGRLDSVSKGATACAGVAKWSPSKGRGPKLAVQVNGVTSGSCAITFSDAKNHTALLEIKVRSSGGQPSPSPSPGGTVSITPNAFTCSTYYTAPSLECDVYYVPVAVSKLVPEPCKSNGASCAVYSVYEATTATATIAGNPPYVCTQKNEELSVENFSYSGALKDGSYPVNVYMHFLKPGDSCSTYLILGYGVPAYGATVFKVLSSERITATSMSPSPSPSP